MILVAVLNHSCHISIVRSIYLIGLIWVEALLGIASGAMRATPREYQPWLNCLLQRHHS